ncbi:hypothetical protein [Hydrogenophaga sp.]|uniref:hypothetical protein n=1 Tax=Hydrogenophaga sp. TaxID=1904254 RepID=UPI00271B0D19|nr:hypothetical protein [Hydrogenophaga sp.]MDO8903953.1 hypothetical protein [Hydrogenophaga sp.]
MTTEQLANEFDDVIREAAITDSNLRMVERLEALKQTALISLGCLPPVGERLEFTPMTRLG